MDEFITKIYLIYEEMGNSVKAIMQIVAKILTSVYPLINKFDDRA